MYYRNILYPYFENFTPLNKPPTLFVILNSILKMENNGVRVPVLDISDKGRKHVFDFDYPLSDTIDKSTFEKTWIDHFLQRRIGEETFIAFKLQLRAKFNEIMPYYNAIFDSIGEKYNIFDGEGYDISITEKENINKDIRDVTSENKTADDTGTNNTVLHSDTESTIDNRYSDTPQNQLTNVQNGTYLTDYTYNSNDGSVDTTNDVESTNKRIEQNKRDNKTDDDTIRNFERNESRTGKVASTDALTKYLNETRNIYTAIYHDCDVLFYQLF